LQSANRSGLNEDCSTDCVSRDPRAKVRLRTGTVGSDGKLYRWLRSRTCIGVGELVSVDMIAASEEPPIDPGSASPVRWSQKKRHYDLVPA